MIILTPGTNPSSGAGEMLKEQIKQQVKNRVNKKAKELIGKTLLKSPVFWGIILGVLAFFLVFYTLAAAISSAQEVAEETQIFEGILPPTIYVRNLEQSITSDFGKRIHPVTGVVESFHKGIDIGIPVGTPVTNSFDGIVTKVSYPGARIQIPHRMLASMSPWKVPNLKLE